MIRIGLFLGAVLALVEVVFAVGGPDRWGGFGRGLLGAVVVSALFGAAVAAGFGLLRHRLAGPLRAGDVRQAGLFTATVLATWALFVHGDGSWLPGVSDPANPLFDLLVMATGCAVCIAILVLSRRRGAATSAETAPTSAERLAMRLSWVAAMIVAIGLGVLALKDNAGSSPAGRLSVATGSPDWPDLATESLSELVPPRVEAVPPGIEAGPRLILVGIDGATWDIVQPLLARGELPHLQSLLQDGIGGILQSTEPSSSPVVWTTIMTGRPPQEHGVDSWRHASAERRRCRALWSILSEHGLKVLAVNVPGSYPADAVRGLQVAGFPTRRLTPNNRGAIFTTHPPADWNVPVRRLSLRRRGESAAGVLDLRERTITLMAGDFCCSRLLPSGWLSDRFAQLLERRFVRLGIAISQQRLRVDCGSQADGFVLQPGRWSPWLKLELRGPPLIFRLKALELDQRQVSIYATPFFSLDPAQAVRPSRLATAMTAGNDPYVIEGAGWTMFREPKLLATLAEQSFGVAAGRLRHVNRLWRGDRWDALICVLTLTDRIQHPFWPFLPAEFHERTGVPQPYPHQAELASAQPWLSEAITRSYVWADRALGEILARATPQTVVAVVSDHGFKSGRHPTSPYAGDHDRNGIYVFKGGPFAGATTGPPHVQAMLPGQKLELTDVMPTLLAAIGLPIARDLDGTVSADLARILSSQGAAIDTIATYENDRPAASDAVPEVDEATLEQIRSLGYID